MSADLFFLHIFIIVVKKLLIDETTIIPAAIAKAMDKVLNPESIKFCHLCSIRAAIVLYKPPPGIIIMIAATKNVVVGVLKIRAANST